MAKSQHMKANLSFERFVFTKIYLDVARLNLVIDIFQKIRYIIITKDKERGKRK